MTATPRASGASGAQRRGAQRRGAPVVSRASGVSSASGAQRRAPSSRAQILTQEKVQEHVAKHLRERLEYLGEGLRRYLMMNGESIPNDLQDDLQEFQDYLTETQNLCQAKPVDPLQLNDLLDDFRNEVGNIITTDEELRNVLHQLFNDIDTCITELEYVSQPPPPTPRGTQQTVGRRHDEEQQIKKLLEKRLEEGLQLAEDLQQNLQGFIQDCNSADRSFTQEGVALIKSIQENLDQAIALHRTALDKVGRSAFGSNEEFLSAYDYSQNISDSMDRFFDKLNPYFQNQENMQNISYRLSCLTWDSMRLCSNAFEFTQDFQLLFPAPGAGGAGVPRVPRGAGGPGGPPASSPVHRAPAPTALVGDGVPSPAPSTAAAASVGDGVAAPGPGGAGVPRVPRGPGGPAGAPGAPPPPPKAAAPAKKFHAIGNTPHIPAPPAAASTWSSWIKSKLPSVERVSSFIKSVPERVSSFTKSKDATSENKVLTEDEASKIAKQYKEKTFDFTKEVPSRKDFYAAKYKDNTGVDRVGVWDVSRKEPKLLSDSEVQENFRGGYELAKKVAFHDQSDINELVQQQSLTMTIEDIQQDIKVAIEQQDKDSISEKLLKHKVDLLQNIELANSTIDELTIAGWFAESSEGLTVSGEWIREGDVSDIRNVTIFLNQIYQTGQLPEPNEMIEAKILEEADINPERLIADCTESLSKKLENQTVTDYEPWTPYMPYAKAKGYRSLPTHFVNAGRLFVNFFKFIANNVRWLGSNASSVEKSFYTIDKSEYVKNLTTLVKQINKLKNDADKKALQNIVVPLVREYAGNFNTSKVDIQTHEKLYFAIRNMDPQNKLSLYSTGRKFAIGDKDKAKLPMRRTYSSIAWSSSDTLQVETKLIQSLKRFRITPENGTSSTIVAPTDAPHPYPYP